MKLLVSAGPTREFIDPVRFVSNASSGKMGYALAAEGARRGHEVTLVSGPTALPAPEGVERVDVVTASEMAEALKSRFPACTTCIMCAAVADYRPVRVFEHKLKKSDGNLVLEFERTEDILLSLGGMKKAGQLLVGFAAESEDLIANAGEKLRRKNLDWIVANRISDGFATSTNACVLLGRNGEKIPFTLRPKTELAAALFDALGL